MNSDEWLREQREMAPEEGPPLKIDTTVAHIARVYDYVLGGKDNYKVDRDAYHALLENNSGAGQLAVINREFLQRGVRYLAHEAGIRQFIDVGSGLPTGLNVHQMAQSVDPSAHVVYVDKDPIVLAHGRALLADDQTTVVIRADGAEPDSILDHPDTRRLIDFDQPWALVMCMFLHHVTDEQDPVGVVNRYKERMISGCYFLESSLLSEDNEKANSLQHDMQEKIHTGYLRPWPVMKAYFEGLEMVEPDLVYASDWRPYLDTSHRDSPWVTALAGGLGRKP